MAITIQQLATKLSLSPSTISRSLRDDKRIHPRTRAKVVAAAIKSGYDLRNRRVKNGNLTTLGVLVGARSLASAREEPNLMRYLQGLGAGSEERNVLLHFNASPLQQETIRGMDSIPVMLREGICSGVILLGRHDTAYVRQLAEQFPVITLSWLYPEINHDAVLAANAASVRDIVSRLVRLGHRKLAWVGDHYSASFFEERQAGFIQACISHDIDITNQVFFGQELFEGANPMAARLLEAVRGGTSAFVCASDYVAMGVTDGLEGHGLNVPQDVSVIGFDASGLSTRSGKKLTSVDPQFVEMGRAAIMLAMERLAEPTSLPRCLTVQARIVEGQTLGPGRLAR